MGKIRIKTLGLDDLEEKQKKADARRREAKTFRQAQGKHLRKVADPHKGTQGKSREGEAEVKPVLAEEPIAQEVKKAGKSEKKSKKDSRKQAAEAGIEETAAAQQESRSSAEQSEEGDKKTAIRKKKIRVIGKKYRQAAKTIDRSKSYSVLEGVALLKKVSYVGFDSTVELHINARETGIKGSAQLPHNIGKNVRVAIFDDERLKKIEKGEIDFDVLIARPSDMPKLVPLAKILGPRGLMPNPKRGTVAENPEEAAKKISAGGLQWKTEAKFPLIHLTIGKVSHQDKELSENVSAIIKSVGVKNITAAFLSSSMSPSIRLKVN